MAAMTSWRRTASAKSVTAWSSVVNVCRELGVGTPDIEGGRALHASERGPFLDTI